MNAPTSLGLQILDSIKSRDINGIYRDTRDANRRSRFWETVITGKTDKGGLFVPGQIPHFGQNLLENLPHLSIPEISACVARHFIPHNAIGNEMLLEMMQNAHNFDLPLEKLDDSTFVLRLDQGPTASFKDVAARELAQLMEQYCLAFGKRIDLVVATSGDTGVAIMNAFGNSKYISVSVLYPTAGVSEIQEKQMLDTMERFSNTQVIPVEGNFDNCQDITILLQAIKSLKKVSNSADYSLEVQKIIEQTQIKIKEVLSSEDLITITKTLEAVELGSANSQNIWRLIPKMTQYCVAVSKALQQGLILPEEKINVAVPSGNVGHLTAGILAREAGLPIDKFIVGTNANNVLKGLINEGVIRHPGFQNTDAPSMDIGDPNNYERILDYAAMMTDYTGTIRYKEMKDEITRLDKAVIAAREERDKLDKTTAPEAYAAAEQKVQNAQAVTVQLTDYGVTKEMIQHLRLFIYVEDVQTNEEMHDAMRTVAETTGKVMETHGIIAEIATRSARNAGFLNNETRPDMPPQENPVVILETAHPDKFPTALDAAGLQVPETHLHADLERLKKMDLHTMGKPEAQTQSLLKIATLICTHARKVRELVA